MSNPIFTEMSLFQTKFDSEMEAILKKAQKLIDLGVSPEKAIKQVLADEGLNSRLENILVFSLNQAAIKAAGGEAYREYIMSEYWDASKLTLSKDLYGAYIDGVKTSIISSIRQAMKDHRTWRQLSRSLFTGYSTTLNLLPEVSLPKYLTTLMHYAKKSYLSPREQLAYRRALNTAMRNINRLAANGAPTQALRASYTELLDVTNLYNQDALNKAIRAATQEKSRYVADRIARTEISRAWGDTLIARYRDNEDVIALKWELNSRHAIYDICDFHAGANLYGLGAGVYPKNVFPKRPAHPHCCCNIRAIYVGNIEDDSEAEQQLISKAKFDSSAATSFIQKLSPKHKVDLFGFDGAIAVSQGKDWRQFLRNWQGS